MGRKPTGSVCVSEAMRLELSFLLKEGYIEFGRKTHKEIFWNINGIPTGDVAIECSYTDNEKWIRLYYVKNEKTLDYKIYLEEINSNLGKGKVLYFVCPQSGKRCRILYMTYGSDIFKSRESYQHRLYYGTQKCSKREYWNTRYFELKDRLDKLWSETRTHTHNGIVTKRIKRLYRLNERKKVCDRIRWSTQAMPKRLVRALEKAKDWT